MGEIGKGFGLYGAVHSSNEKGAFTMFTAFNAKTPPGAGAIVIPSQTSYAGVVPVSLVGLSWSSQVQTMSYFQQGTRDYERTIASAEMAVSASPASTITGATFNKYFSI